METSMVSKKNKVWVTALPAITLLALLCGALAGCSGSGNDSASSVLTQALSESLGDATAARFDINTGTGNLTIDRLPDGEQLLASGALEYLENQEPPAWTVNVMDGLATLTLKASGGRQAGFQLPWAACNGETSWQIHLNPNLPSDITAYSDGGNVKLDLAGMAVTHLAAETGGGNVDVVLPDHAAALNVMAKTGGGSVTVAIGSGTTGINTVTASSGAGDVVVRLPVGMAASIHASTGLGKLTIDPRFTKIDEHTYQSPDYDNAADKVEITVESGAGEVKVMAIDS